MKKPIEQYRAFGEIKTIPTANHKFHRILITSLDDTGPLEVAYQINSFTDSLPIKTKLIFFVAPLEHYIGIEDHINNLELIAFNIEDATKAMKTLKDGTLGSSPINYTRHPCQRVTDLDPFIATNNKNHLDGKYYFGLNNYGNLVLLQDNTAYNPGDLILSKRVDSQLYLPNWSQKELQSAPSTGIHLSQFKRKDYRFSF